ncbi:hybrid sensor histidine kinase/response regulator [Mariprofundus ferrooxydans]|uniref:histidine kinase n=1 Tax=Mariprofundus ferrooxydans PV-1 TaxID=314345 RepID=Q0F0C6_9PROT|nr:PAS domain S-box protein [Mariprofundus ferrooxydans]EAU55102.1 Multi-sensor Hybrid Histidine Kinase [Mariprofundus ferrooxydans PV-1]KON46860.1 histidine kinase [Mariprofundus ferrooxydans]
MKKVLADHIQYSLLLIAIVSVSEYLVIELLSHTQIVHTLSRETRAVADSLLLILIAAGPIYFFIIKPVIVMTTMYQHRLQYLTDAVEDAGDAIIIMDTSGNITYVNKAFETISGYASEEVNGHHFRLLKSEQHSHNFYQVMIRSVVNTGSWKGDIYSKHKSGEELPRHLHIKSMFDSQGKLASYIANLSDISESKQQEKLLRQAMKMETVGTLVGGVSHNFNNLLAGISGKLYLAKKHTTHPKALVHLQDIETLSNDAAKIVSQLLTFSHASPQKKQNMNIVQVLKDAIKTAQLGMREDIVLTTDFTSEALTTYCDPVEIQQVLINLMNNARDALGSANRKIMVTVKKKERQDCPSMASCQTCTPEVVYIAVEDTGSGIAETDITHVFDPFFTTKKVGNGTGLGLSSAKGIVEMHGGVIRVNSTLGVGTKFEICIPLISGQAFETEHTQQIIAADTKKTLLVIDDSDIVRATLSQLLQSLGYTVLLAKNGRRGVKKFYEYSDQIALVISDIVMPVLDGPSAVTLMREIRPEIPAIFLTGYTNDNVLDDTYDNHLTVIMEKPFSIVTLSQTVHNLLHPDESGEETTGYATEKKQLDLAIGY